MAGTQSEQKPSNGGSQPDGRHRVRAPGLDGVRALAVLAVIAFHLGLRATPAGFLGVDVFFVLSGYLITDLLVARRERFGTLDLRGFWLRRARRLLPALAVLLVVVTAAVAVIEPGQLGALRPALAAAVTYSSNWYQALHHESYFASFGPPPPLQHLWSLAIEEQFYLVWPLMLLVIVRIGSRRLRAGAAWAGAAASAAAMAVVYVPGSDPSLVYYGTGTHATALLAGAAMALTWPLQEVATAPFTRARRLDGLGIAGLAVLAWSVGHFSGADPAVYPAGLVLAALAAAGLVVAAAAPGLVGDMLSWTPLRWIGVRSYGIYLWHWPVIALTAAIAPRAGGPWLWLVEAAVAVGLAAASWRWVESPILRDGFRVTLRSARQRLTGSLSTAWRSPVGAVPVVAAMAALSVACTAGYGVLRPPAGSSGLQRQISEGARVSASTRAQLPPAAGTPAAGTPAAVSRGTPSPSATASPPAAQPVTVHGSEITAVGDSVMLAAAPELHDALPGIYIDAKVSRQMGAGVGIVGQLAHRGWLRKVLVVGLGTNGTVTSGNIHQLAELAGPRRKIVLVNTFVPRPWEQPDNQVIAAAAHRYPNVVLANWNHIIRHRTGLLWDDGIHPRPPGGTLYAKMIKAAVTAALAPAQPPARPDRSQHLLAEPLLPLQLRTRPMPPLLPRSGQRAGAGRLG